LPEQGVSHFKDQWSLRFMELVAVARTRTFWGEKILLSPVEIDAQAHVPNHTHPHEQGGIVVEGEMEMGIGGEVLVLKPEDMYIIIPGGVEHYARCGLLIVAQLAKLVIIRFTPIPSASSGQA
jgi:mannose-6-phosphate isomerase-like protein (cupin superfamily)